jgi:hypothetical protein
MKRILIAGPLLLGLAACRTESSVAPNAAGPQAPSFDIRDKFHDNGNSNFYFLPPTVPNPGNGADKDKNDVGSAPDVRVTITAWADGQDPGLCLGDPTNTPGTPSPSNCAPAGGLKADLTNGLTKLEVNNSEYKTHWKIPADPTVYYRILVYLDLGTTTKTLGWADLKTGANGGALKGTNTYEYVPKEDKSDLEIKFRIVSQCKNQSACGERYVDLSGPTNGPPVTIFLGDPSKPIGGVTIPPQGTGGVVKFAVESCPDLPLDIPLFGTCIRVTTDPSGEGGPYLGIPATVFSCDAVKDAGKLVGGISGDQSESVRMHRKDASTIVVLPPGTANCPQLTGQHIGPADFLRSLVHGNWKQVGQQLATLVSPTPLYARRLHQGGGGSTCCFSDFQNALPSGIEVDNFSAPTGIVVTDIGSRPVMNAQVHFILCDGTEKVVKSDANGFSPLPKGNLNYAFGYGLGFGEGPEPYFPWYGPVTLDNPPRHFFDYHWGSCGG